MVTAAPAATLPDPRVCEQARLSRDPRFDGLFFTAVSSTGIYCRPVCPAPAPRPSNVRYYGSAAAAEAAGYRPCLRCRPELSPGEGAWRRGDETVARALKLIDQGALADAPLASLADRVGIGERQLRRLFVDRVGAAPIGVHGTRRLLFAKQLLTETALSVTDVAMAAGFGSLRRFNTTFREAYRMAPRDLRRRPRTDGDDALVLRLGYRPPHDLAAMLAILGQQVSVAAARTLATRIAHRFGTALDAPPAPGLTHLFPTPEVLADADLAGIGLTRARADTVRGMARALLDGRIDFRPERTLDDFVARWTALPGIGAWTAHYVAMRALGHPDAFPADDLVLRRALAVGDETPPTARALTGIAEAWRPWRAYAVIHLWRDATPRASA